MFSLVYVSSATVTFSADDLRALLEQSRRDNAARQVSGILLFKGGNFMQLLEGDEAVVRNLYKKISLDRRHTGSLVLLNSNADERMFADWSMAFRDLNDKSVTSLPGFSPFLNTEFNSREFSENPTRAHALLQYFKQNMR
jgi:hypothetical protein